MYSETQGKFAKIETSLPKYACRKTYNHNALGYRILEPKICDNSPNYE